MEFLIKTQKQITKSGDGDSILTFKGYWFDFKPTFRIARYEDWYDGPIVTYHFFLFTVFIAYSWEKIGEKVEK